MNVTKLNQKIDALANAGVCREGIVAIRKLVEEITGEKLTPEVTAIKKKYRAGDWFRKFRDTDRQLYDYGVLAQVGYGEIQFISFEEFGQGHDANRGQDKFEPASGSAYDVTLEELIKATASWRGWERVDRPF